MSLIGQLFQKINPYRHLPMVREYLAARAVNGPYRFLVREWSDIANVNLAARVMETEYFQDEVIPVPIRLKGIRSLVVLAPHQDDEIIGAGGTLALARDFGVDVHVIYVTDGQQNANENSSVLRNQEAQAVCRSLGATPHYLNVSNLNPVPTLADVDKLSGWIAEFRPSAILSPWLLDFPAKHRMVNHLIWTASQRRSLGDAEVWGYQVHNTVYANAYVDITSVAQRKRDLLSFYRSQNENYYRYDHMAMGMAAWNGRFLRHTKHDGSERYFEMFFTLPNPEFLSLIERFYFQDPTATYHGKKNLIAALAQLHKDLGNKKFQVA